MDAHECRAHHLSRGPRLGMYLTPQTAAHRPWYSPGKNTGVGCHFRLQCMKVKSESEVAQSCPTLSDPMDCSPPGSSWLNYVWISLASLPIYWVIFYQCYQ